MELKGFMVCEAGKPVTLELNDEIVGGLTISEPIPVFNDADDAELAAMSNQSRYGSRAMFDICHVTISIGDVHHTVTYDEDVEDEGDDEHDGEWST